MEIKELRGQDVSWIINMEDEVTMNDDSGRRGQKQVLHICRTERNLEVCRLKKQGGTTSSKV